MLNKIYYDSFTNEYCLPSEEDFGIAPPERYIPTYRGSDDKTYIENWLVNVHPELDEDLRLSIAFSKDEYYDKKMHSCILSEQEQKHNCRLIMLKYWIIPDDKFDEYCHRFDLKNH